MKHLYLNWNLSARKMVPLSWGKNRAALQEYHPYFVELFPEPELRRSTWAVADILTHKAREIQSVWEGSSALKTKPLALIWGDQDGFVSKKHRRGWKENFSVQQEFILENAGHFPQLESPQEVAAALGLFLDA